MKNGIMAISAPAAPDAPASGGAGAARASKAAAQGRVVFFGDSLTAGYGLPSDQSFPALVGQQIRELRWPLQVVNAGLSGDTTAGGRRRFAQLLGKDVRLVVLALGGNDALRGLDLEATRKNLEAMIELARSRSIPVMLAAMEIPPLYGPDHSRRFRQIYLDLAKKHGIPLIPFLLAGVVLNAAYNLPDLIHPNARGHRLIAENVWAALKPALEQVLVAMLGEAR